MLQTFESSSGEVDLIVILNIILILPFNQTLILKLNLILMLNPNPKSNPNLKPNFDPSPDPKSVPDLILFKSKSILISVVITNLNLILILI